MRRPDMDGLDANLPQVDADTCVLGAAVNASCRACVDACPRGAWIIGDDGLGLATAACDGCGLCVPVCPPAAIELTRPLAPVRSIDTPDAVLVACEVAVAAPGKGVVPCLHAFGLEALAALYRQGARKFVVARGDCATCARGAGATFDRAAHDLARLLDDRVLEPVELVPEPADRWQVTRDDHLRPSRRSLFNAFRQPAPSASEAEATPARTAASTLPAGQPKRGLVPVQPEIDEDMCTACDACARICPEQAITIDDRGEARAAYTVAPARCTGCRLCVDLCESGAVRLNRWTTERPRDVVLDAAQCTACGNVFRVVEGRLSDPLLCRICANSRHSRNLFQVMK